MKTLNALLCVVIVVALATSATASTGTVKWFNSSKGFGFIVPGDGGEDLFVHHSDFVGDGSGLLTEGENVGYLQTDTTYYWKVDEFAIYTIEPVEVALGEITVGTSRTVELSVMNLADLELVLATCLASDGDFRIDSAVPDTIEPGETIGIKITYAPSAEGPASGRLEFNGQPGITLTGTGVPPAQWYVQAVIEEAVGDLEAAVADGLLGAEQGMGLMDELTYAARLLATDAIDAAITAGAAPDEIAEAGQYLAQGDELWIALAFMDAVAKYKDALACEEGAEAASAATQDGGGIKLFTKKESLIVASKVKAYIKSVKMMTSSEAVEAVSKEYVYTLLDAAVARTKANRRSTVKAQDL